MNTVMHEAVGMVGKALGVPDSPIEKVTCVDCGRRVVSISCVWVFDFTTKTITGPMCGYHKRGE